MTTAMDQDIEKLLKTPGIGLESQWNEIEHKWRDVLVSLVSNLSLVKRDDPEINVNRTSIYQHADHTLTQIDGLLTALHTVSRHHENYLQPKGLTEEASEQQLSKHKYSTRNPYLVSTQCRCQHKHNHHCNLKTSAWRDVYNWTVGNTAKLNKVWDHYRKFYVDFIKYLVQYCSQDNDTDILNELKKKEKRLYEFESVDSCQLTSIPGLKEATTEWKYNGWKEEFETNSQLSKFLNKNLVNISKLLTCKAYYQKCIAYQALQASMQPMFEAFLKSGLERIVEGVEKNLEMRMDAFDVLDNFMQVWDGDLDDLMDNIEFFWDAENIQDMLNKFGGKRKSAPDNQFLLKIYEYFEWLLKKQAEEQDDNESTPN